MLELALRIAFGLTLTTADIGDLVQLCSGLDLTFDIRQSMHHHAWHATRQNTYDANHQDTHHASWGINSHDICM